MKTLSFNKIQVLAALSLMGVFIIDNFTPATFVIDILYLCCILIVFKQNDKTIIGFSIAACLLIMVNVLSEHDEKENWPFFINRSISVLAIFITSYISVHYSRLHKKAMESEKRYFQSLEEMLFITSHQVRKPLASILGLIAGMHAEKQSLRPEDLKERIDYLQLSASELDSFIQELNRFIQRAEQRHGAGQEEKAAAKKE